MKPRGWRQRKSLENTRKEKGLSFHDSNRRLIVCDFGCNASLRICWVSNASVVTKRRHVRKGSPKNVTHSRRNGNQGLKAYKCCKSLWRRKYREKGRDEGMSEEKSDESNCHPLSRCLFTVTTQLPNARYRRSKEWEWKGNYTTTLRGKKEALVYERVDIRLWFQQKWFMLQ